MKQKQLNNRITVIENKSIDKMDSYQISLDKPGGGKYMNGIVCLDELSEQEEIIDNRISKAASFYQRISTAIFVCRESRKLLKDTRRWFFNEEYQQLAEKTSLEEMRELIPNLRKLIDRQNNIVLNLHQIRNFIVKLFVNISIKNIQTTSNIMEDKIQDYVLATDNKFLDAAEKILDGANNHHLDINKVTRIESFV